MVFSYGLTGPILPLWFMKVTPTWRALQARGSDAAYIDGVFRQHQHRHVLHLDDRDSGVRGSRRLVHQRMMKKHFIHKAGIA